MNRDVAGRILTDMRAGRRVAVLSETRPLARAAFTEVAAHATAGERIRRAEGRERVDVAGGKGFVVFGTSRSRNRFRGITLDVVVFDAHEPSPDALADVAPSLLLGGEVVRT